MNQSDIYKYLMDAAEVRSEKINNFLESQLQFCHPKIKGEITKGKIKWRGIRVVSQKTISSKVEFYLTQRGKKIGVSIIL